MAIEEYRKRQGKVLLEKETEVQKLRQEIDQLQEEKISLEN